MSHQVLGVQVPKNGHSGAEAGTLQPLQA